MPEVVTHEHPLIKGTASGSCDMNLCDASCTGLGPERACAVRVEPGTGRTYCTCQHWEKRDGRSRARLIGGVAVVAVVAIIVGTVIATRGGGSKTSITSVGDLPRIVLGPSEGPFPYLASQSGPTDLGPKSSYDGADKAQLGQLGFEGQYLAAYQDPARGFAEAVAIAFRDAKGASGALAFFQSRTAAKAAGTAIAVPTLGDEAVGVEFSAQGAPGFFYAWRDGNALGLVTVVDASGVTVDTARNLALVMDRRFKT